MRKMKTAFSLIVFLVLCMFVSYQLFSQFKGVVDRQIVTSKNLGEIRKRVGLELSASLSAVGLELGAPTFIRIW